MKMIGLIATVAAAFAASPANAEWQYEQRIDPMTDQARAVAFVRNEVAEFAFSCQGSLYFVHVASPEFSPELQEADAQHRFDNLAPETLFWIYRDSAAIAASTPDSEASFLRLLTRSAASRRVVFSFPTSSITARLFEFDLTGSREAIEAMMASCEWPSGQPASGLQSSPVRAGDERREWMSEPVYRDRPD